MPLFYLQKLQIFFENISFSENLFQYLSVHLSYKQRNKMENKTDRIIFRLTPTEKGKLIRKAKKAKMKVSDYLRSIINN